MRRPPKRVHKNSLIGQQGINLIATIVGEMAFLWTPTTGVSDAGIDGFIEIRDPTTGDVTNLILQIQSKATGIEWENETTTGFFFRCDERDLSYWLQGNAPVLLIVSRPSTKECYWVSIKDYFKDMRRQKSRKVYFDKIQNLFSKSSGPELINLAMPENCGLYLAPPPISENLHSNLIPVSRYAQSVFVAETPYRDKDKVKEKLRELGVRGKYEWLLKEDKLYSFYDLRKAPWSELCEAGTTEEHPTDDWALSNDPVRKNDFVRLLGLALQGFLGTKGIWYSPPKNGSGHYYYAPSRASEPEQGDSTDKPVKPAKELPPKTVKWKLQKESERTVFKAYYGKQDPSRIVYYRHLAFSSRFRRLGTTWYLELTPTYHFTSDGTKISNYSQHYLSGIKRIEKHVAVHGNVRFWSYVLTERDMFTRGTDFIRFSECLAFATNFGIPESDWLSRADEEEKQHLGEIDTSQILLFNES